ncbi:MAG: hypothetical protein WCD07_08300 [Burkholderiales bacterium]
MLSKFKLLLILACAFVLSSCAGGLQQVLPGSLTLTPGQLQNTLAKGFPFTKNYLGLIDVTFANPQLSMQPDTKRILSGLETTFKNPLTGTPYTGKLNISSALGYDPTTRSVLLKEPQLENLDIPGLSPLLIGQLTKVANLVAQEKLKEYKIHSFQPGELNFFGVPLEPKGIEVTAKGLLVSLAK